MPKPQKLGKWKHPPPRFADIRPTGVSCARDAALAQCTLYMKSSLRVQFSAQAVKSLATARTYLQFNRTILRRQNTGSSRMEMKHPPSSDAAKVWVRPLWKDPHPQITSHKCTIDLCAGVLRPANTRGGDLRLPRGWRRRQIARGGGLRLPRGRRRKRSTGPVPKCSSTTA